MPKCGMGDNDWAIATLLKGKPGSEALGKRGCGTEKRPVVLKRVPTSKPLKSHELGHNHLGDVLIRLPNTGAGACAGLAGAT